MTPLPSKARVFPRTLTVTDLRKTLKRQEIDAIFDAHDNQEAVLTALYKLAFPEWDAIKSVDGWPAIGKEAGLYIMKKFMEFDREHHPAVFNGGLWMNNGFSVHEGAGFGPWDLSTDHCKVHMMTRSSAVRSGDPSRGMEAATP